MYFLYFSCVIFCDNPVKFTVDIPNQYSEKVFLDVFCNDIYNENNDQISSQIRTIPRTTLQKQLCRQLENDTINKVFRCFLG